MNFPLKGDTHLGPMTETVKRHAKLNIELNSKEVRSFVSERKYLAKS